MTGGADTVFSRFWASFPDGGAVPSGLPDPNNPYRFNYAGGDVPSQIEQQHDDAQFPAAWSLGGHPAFDPYAGTIPNTDADMANAWYTSPQQNQYHQHQNCNW